MNGNHHFWLGAIFGLVVGIVSAGYARADETKTATPIPPEEVESVIQDVTAFLANLPQKQRIALPSPSVIFQAYETPLRGYAGLTVEGVAVINSTRPKLCRRIDLGHEATHILLGRIGMTPSESEPYARRWDLKASEDPYVPGCAGSVNSRIAEMKP